MSSSPSPIPLTILLLAPAAFGCYLITTDQTIFAGYETVGAGLIPASLLAAIVYCAQRATSKHTELMSLLNATNLRGADLRDITVRNIYLRERDLSRSDLTGSTLSNADLTDAKLVESQLARASMIGCIMLRTNAFLADLERANIRGSVLLGANFREINGCRLRAWAIGGSGMNFDYSILVRASFFGARAPRSSFKRTRLDWASFRSADLLASDFSDSFGTSVLTRN